MVFEQLEKGQFAIKSGFLWHIKCNLSVSKQKKITYVLIAGNLPVITGVQKFCVRHICLKPVLGG